MKISLVVIIYKAILFEHFWCFTPNGDEAGFEEYLDWIESHPWNFDLCVLKIVRLPNTNCIPSDWWLDLRLCSAKEKLRNKFLFIQVHFIWVLLKVLVDWDHFGGRTIPAAWPGWRHRRGEHHYNIFIATINVWCCCNDVIMTSNPPLTSSWLREWVLLQWQQFYSKVMILKRIRTKWN